MNKLTLLIFFISGQALLAQDVVKALSAKPDVPLVDCARQPFLYSGAPLQSWCIHDVYTTDGVKSQIKPTLDRVANVEAKTSALADSLQKTKDNLDVLNQRVAADESALPQQIDQYAVKKLLDRIAALEARVKEIEGKESASTETARKQ